MALATYTDDLPNVDLEMSINEARALLADLEECTLCVQSERIKTVLHNLLEG